MPKQVTAEYNRIEYTVFLNGEEVYSAGNAPGDSSLRIPSERGVGLRNMRKFCIKTAKQIAAEKKAEYAGVERIPDRDDIPG